MTSIDRSSPYSFASTRSSFSSERPSSYKNYSNAIAEYTATVERLRSRRNSVQDYATNTTSRRAPSLTSLDSIGRSSSVYSPSARLPPPVTGYVSRTRATFTEPTNRDLYRRSLHEEDIKSKEQDSASKRSNVISNADESSTYASSKRFTLPGKRTYSREESLEKAREIIAKANRGKEKEENGYSSRRYSRESSTADSGVESYQSSRATTYERSSSLSVPSSPNLSSNYGRLNGHTLSSYSSRNTSRESSPLRQDDKRVSTETEQASNGYSATGGDAHKWDMHRQPSSYLYRRSPEKETSSSGSRAVNRTSCVSNSERTDNCDIDNEKDTISVGLDWKYRTSSPRSSLGKRSTPASSSSSRRGTINLDESDRAGLIGLKNIGNTCFMNSVIQCLSNSKSLRDYCTSGDYEADLNTASTHREGPLISAFANVMEALWKKHSSYSSSNAYDPDRFHRKIQQYAPRFSGYLQQDAQEFLRYLLEGLHEDVNRVSSKPRPETDDISPQLSDAQKSAEAWKRYMKRDNSKIVELFVGQLKSSLICDRCEYCSVTFDPFWDLALPIPIARGSSLSEVNIYDCFANFTRKEELDGDERPTCARCQSRQRCTKFFTIQRFPKLLVIHLKRFSQERYRAKISSLVEYPVEDLDLSRFASESYTGSRPKYNLYAVSCHAGSTHCGHYTAYCKHPSSGRWSEYNDSRVTSVSVSDVVTPDAYVLFYELVS